MDHHHAYRTVLQDAAQCAIDYLESLETAPAGTTVPLDTLRERLVLPLNDEGIAPEQVLREMLEGTEGGVMGSAGGRFFGWVVGGALPAALAADWMTSAWDQNAVMYASAPAAIVIEEVTGVWLKDLLGLPAGASFALVTGSQMAHVTCLMAARHAMLARQGWDVERQGLWNAPRIRLLSGSQRHGTIERAVRLLGLGTESVIDLPVDSEGKLPPAALAAALREQPGTPTIVLLQAGDVNTGVFDSFADLIPIAHEAGAWVHIDGAFGLWAGASPKLRHLTNGVGEADSWVTDGHKWLNTPYDCGYAFVRDPAAHSAAMAYQASYLAFDTTTRNAMDWTPEWSRRARGTPTYAAIRELGRAGIANLVERCSRYAGELVERIGALPGAEKVWKSEINQGLVRFLDPRPGATEADHARWTDEVIAAIVRDGEAFFSGTTWQGKRCMRVSVSSWQTTERDIDRSVAAVERVLHSMSM